MKTRHLIKYLILLLALTSCSGLKREDTFSEVQSRVKETLNKDSYWIRSSTEESLIEARVIKLFSAPLNKDKAIELTLLNNRELQATYENLNIREADLLEAGLFKNPSFSSEIGISSGGLDLGFGLVQDFVNILKIPLLKKIEKEKLEGEKVKVVEEILKHALKTELDYTQYLGLKNILEIMKDRLIASESSVAIAKELYQAGSLSELNYLKYEANKTELDLEIAKTNQDIKNLRESLNIDIGYHEKHDIWDTEKTLNKTRFEGKEEDIIKQSLANSTLLAINRYEFLSALYELNLVSQFRLLQDGSTGVSSSIDNDMGPNFNITIPIFNQGLPEIIRKEAKLKSLYESYLATHNKVTSQARSLFRQLNIEKSRLHSYEKNLIPLRTKILKETQKQYNAMFVSNLSLLEMKTEEIRTREESLKSLINYNLLNAKLTGLKNGILTED